MSNKVKLGGVCKKSSDCSSNMCFKGICQSAVGSEEELASIASKMDSSIKKQRDLKEKRKNFNKNSVLNDSILNKL